ncbi:MAG: AAA family ATPase [Proteobacteria bacterium]|nr:AAA family ATPase [Pseudomonadota bacterium]MBU1688699.1 AAA family ATPase [Pseudomonadota bacterium]
MLNSMHIREFTVFKDVRLDFSPGLNVIVGENGTGKTHLLKLGYLFCRAWPDLKARRLSLSPQRTQAYLDERLAGLFRVGDLASLIRQGHKNGASLQADVTGHIPTTHIRLPQEPPPQSPGISEEMPWHIQIKRGKNAPADVQVLILPDGAASNAFLPQQVFVPSKEMVSLFKGLIGLFEKYREFPLDETYRDLAVAMSTLEPRETSSLLPVIMKRIQTLLGGDLRLDNGDLVFERSDGSRLETQLMAEGYRKLALIIYLLRYGVIERGSTLFWDEPESNLNPAAIRLLAEALFVLSGLGVQVIVATHSLFLLREFEILHLKAKSVDKPKPRYLGLSFKRGQVMVSQGNDIADLDSLVLLDENILQGDRFQEVGQ